MSLYCDTATPRPPSPIEARRAMAPPRGHGRLPGCPAFGRRPVVTSGTPCHAGADRSHVGSWVRALTATAALAVSACSPQTPEVPAPMSVPAAATASASGPGGAGSLDPSLPDASTVLAPATAPPAGEAAGRSNRSMTRAQESSAMPMPGQNNDHSAPLPPAKAASAR